MTVNSTTSELVQDNSSVEYIDSHENSIATIPRDDASVQDVEDPRSLELIFGQKHKEIDCALCPTAKRACNRAWVTAKQVENWSKMSKTTMWRWLEKLEKARRIASVSDMKQTYIQDSCGVPHETTLYNLNVLNQLAMVCIDNEKLNDISCKFSDILSEVETTGSYSIRKPDSYMIEDKIERAKRWIEETEEWQKALSSEETAHAETKALLAEEKEKSETLERTKSWIGDKKVATAMGTAGALSKKCDRLEKELDQVKSERDLQIYNTRETIRKEFEESWTTAREWCYKHGLPTHSKELKWKVSDKLAEICLTYPNREKWRTNPSNVRIFPKWACDILDKMYDEDDTFLSEYRKV